MGRAARRWGPVLIGLVLLAFGIACLNYTKPGTVEHHRAWADEHARPAPGDGILWGGAGAAVVGAFGLGFGAAGLARGRSA